MTGKLRCAVLSSLILTALSGMKEGVAQGTTEPLRVRANAAEITLSGRVQAQLNTTSVDGLPPTEAILRRLRLGIDFRINDFISGRIHPELSSSQLSLGDAYGQLNFSPAAQLQVGRFQRPFGTIEEQSSLRILPIERGTRIRGVTDAELSGILSPSLRRSRHGHSATRRSSGSAPRPELQPCAVRRTAAGDFRRSAHSSGYRTSNCSAL